MSKLHELKTWPGQFEATLRGWKRHEFRLNDRGFVDQDYLLLREWLPIPEGEGAPGRYSGREALVRVTYLGTGFGIPEGYVCMSIAWPEYRKCRAERCDLSARHGPDGEAIVCWAHAGNWPECSPVLIAPPDGWPPAGEAHG